MNNRHVFTSLSLCFLFSWFSDISAMKDIGKHAVVSLAVCTVFNVLGKNDLIGRIEECEKIIKKFDLSEDATLKSLVERVQKNENAIQELSNKKRDPEKMKKNLYLYNQESRIGEILNNISSVEEKMEKLEESISNYEDRVDKIENYIKKKKLKKRKRKQKRMEQQEDDESSEDEGYGSDSSMRPVKN